MEAIEIAATDYLTDLFNEAGNISEVLTVDRLREAVKKIEEVDKQ
jgi:hypothetical protein